MPEGYNVVIDGTTTQCGDGPNGFLMSIRLANRYTIGMHSGGRSTHTVTWKDGAEIITHTDVGDMVKGNG